MPYKEFEPEKLYYSIGEVAKLLGVSTSLIRFWENEFEVIKPVKNKKGNRQFTKEDVENLQIIFQLVKQKGMTLQGAKEYFKNNSTSERQRLKAIQSLNEIKTYLLKLRDSIE